MAAYGEECARPKHHHRLHLPRDILKLGFVPHCATMEGKHRALKGARIVDNQKRNVNAPAEFQEGVLPRLLLADITEDQPWTYVLLGVTHKASSHARSIFGDDSLRHSATARGLIGSLNVGDVVIWKWPSHAGRVQELVHSTTTPLHVSVRRLRFSGTTKWGSTWRLTDEVTWHRLDQPTRWLPASWWQQIDQSIDCIH